MLEEIKEHEKKQNPAEEKHYMKGLRKNAENSDDVGEKWKRLS